MRAAKMTEHPAFTLMKQTDIQNLRLAMFCGCRVSGEQDGHKIYNERQIHFVFHYIQMPRWLFSDPRYAGLSLEAKVAYTFLLNRFQLSRRNGWINEMGEVFVIFPRKELAKELRICEQRVTAAFRALGEAELVWEKRCGRGDANQIYLASVTPVDDPAYMCAPFQDPEPRTSDPEVFAEPEVSAHTQEPPFSRSLNRENGASRTAGNEVQEPQEPRPSKIEIIKPYQSEKEVSQSLIPARGDGPADDEELTGILEACELTFFEQRTARVFENAIERLWYADSFRIGNATLPRSRVRARLRLLDHEILEDAEQKLHSNLDRDVKNSTAYVMATIFNCIAEAESDLMVDPYLNVLRAPPREVRRCC